MGPKHTAVTLLLAWFCAPSGVYGSGTVSLKLQSYGNIAHGKLASASCCDGVTGSSCLTVTCDPYFVVTITGQNPQTQNLNIRLQTDSLHDEENVNFTDLIGKTPNPFSATFDVWPGTVHITVDVMDNNSDINGLADGLIARLSTTYSMPWLTSFEDNFFLLHFIPDLSILTALINVRCDSDSNFLNNCSKSCESYDNATGHIGCDTNGDLTCLPGWGGDPNLGCLLASRCVHNTCQNGGHCTETASHEFQGCSCVYPYTGKYCDTISTTTSTTTQSTTTKQTVRCETTTCQNGGTCLEVQGSDGYSYLTCSCVQPYNGQRCEKSPTTETTTSTKPPPPTTTTSTTTPTTTTSTTTTPTTTSQTTTKSTTIKPSVITSKSPTTSSTSAPTTKESYSEKDDDIFILAVVGAVGCGLASITLFCLLVTFLAKSCKQTRIEDGFPGKPKDNAGASIGDSGTYIGSSPHTMKGQHCTLKIRDAFYDDSKFIMHPKLPNQPFNYDWNNF